MKQLIATLALLAPLTLAQSSSFVLPIDTTLVVAGGEEISEADVVAGSTVETAAVGFRVIQTFIDSGATLGPFTVTRN